MSGNLAQVRAVPVTARWIVPGDELLYGRGAKGSKGKYVTIGRADADGVCTVTSRTDPDDKGLIHLAFKGGKKASPHPRVWAHEMVWLVVP